MLILNIQMKAWQNPKFLWCDFEKTIDLPTVPRYAAIIA
jgi:hypothetical protein